MEGGVYVGLRFAASRTLRSFGGARDRDETEATRVGGQRGAGLPGGRPVQLLLEAGEREAGVERGGHPVHLGRPGGERPQRGRGGGGAAERRLGARLEQRLIVGERDQLGLPGRVGVLGEQAARLVGTAQREQRRRQRLCCRHLVGHWLLAAYLGQPGTGAALRIRRALLVELQAQQ